MIAPVLTPVVTAMIASAIPAAPSTLAGLAHILALFSVQPSACENRHSSTRSAP